MEPLPTDIFVGTIGSVVSSTDAAAVFAVLRDHTEVLVRRGQTRLEIGDHVSVFVSADERALIHLLFGGPDDGTERSW